MERWGMWLRTIGVSALALALTLASGSGWSPAHAQSALRWDHAL